MSFKSKALGLIAALGLAVTFAGSAVAVDITANTGTAVVTLADDGVFQVILTGGALTPSGPVNAFSTGVTASGSIRINYIDTKSFRDGFDTRLLADDFTSPLLIPLTSNFYGIDSSKLVVTQSGDGQQCRWTSGVGFRIGDIGPTSNGGDNDHSGGGTQSWASVSHALANLGVSQLVGFGFKGPGTASSAACPGSFQDINLRLDVPNNTPATTYTSVLHVSVTFDSTIP